MIYLNNDKSKLKHIDEKASCKHNNSIPYRMQHLVVATPCVFYAILHRLYILRVNRYGGWNYRAKHTFRYRPWLEVGFCGRFNFRRCCFYQIVTSNNSSILDLGMDCDNRYNKSSKYCIRLDCRKKIGNRAYANE